MKYLLLIICAVTIASCVGKQGDCGPMPEGNANVRVRITKVIANPMGADQYNESFEITNFSDKELLMEGWKIVNSKGLAWELDEMPPIEPCKSKTVMSVHRDGLINTGDTIDLINDDNMLVQRLKWGKLNDGEIVYPK